MSVQFVQPPNGTYGNSFKGGVAKQNRTDAFGARSPLFNGRPYNSAPQLSSTRTSTSRNRIISPLKIQTDVPGPRSRMYLHGPITSADLTQLGGIPPEWQTRRWGDQSLKHPIPGPNTWQDNLWGIQNILKPGEKNYQYGGVATEWKQDAFGRKSSMYLGSIPITAAHLAQLGGEVSAPAPAPAPAWQAHIWGDNTPIDSIF